MNILTTPPERTEDKSTAFSSISGFIHLSSFNPYHFYRASLVTKPSMPGRKAKQKAKWSMYGELHDEVSRLLDETGLSLQFHEDDSEESCTRAWDTNVMGRFRCRNAACKSKGWSSKKIATTIRLYSGERYNARVYHQRCIHCNRLSRPVLDNSYADRVAYRIMIWNGFWVESPVISGARGRPHNSALCEGCKAGHCTESRDDLVLQMERSAHCYTIIF